MLVGGADQIAHLPVTGRQRIEQPLLHVIHVEVHESGAGLVLDHEAAAVGQEGDGRTDVVDILVGGLLVDDLLRPLQVVHQHAQAVLQAVDAVEIELAVRRPAEIGHIVVLRKESTVGGSIPLGRGGHLDGHRLVPVQVIDMERHHGILLAGRRVFVGKAARVERIGHRTGLRLGVEIEAVLLHAALVETQEGELASVRRPAQRFGQSPLLLVDPVGQAVDDVVGLAVEGHARLGTGGHVAHVDVVAEHKGHPVAVGRADGIAHAVARREPLARPAGNVIDHVARKGRTPVEGPAVDAEDDLVLVGTQFIPGDPPGLDPHLLRGGEGAHRTAGGIGMLHDRPVLAGRIMGAVGHGADAGHGFRRKPAGRHVRIGKGGRRTESGRPQRDGCRRGQKEIFHAFLLNGCGRPRNLPAGPADGSEAARPDRSRLLRRYLQALRLMSRLLMWWVSAPTDTKSTPHSA